MEDNFRITLYENKIQYISLIIIAILIVIGMVAMLLLLETGLEIIVLAAFSLILGWAFWKLNTENKNRVFVKKNGQVYDGRVLHVRVKKIKNRVDRRLLVELFDGNERRLIVSEHFPYHIDRVSSKNVNEEEYNRCYKENIIEHIQYYGNGYIAFEETEQTKFLYRYKKSKNKNYNGDLTCRVYEFEGKYVVDDFEGYSYSV